MLAAVIIAISVLSSTDDGGTSVLSLLVGSGAAPLADPLQTVTGVGLFGLFFAAVASLFRRRRSASAVERQQLKWVAYAGAILAMAFLGTSVAFFSPLRELDPDATVPVTMLGGVPFVTGLIAVPVAVGVAVLRYRLYDIDVLIRRTLIYAALSAVLVGAYVGGVALFESLLAPFTAGNGIAVAVSTLAVVALFQPVRRRIQAAVDHRFFRSRYGRRADARRLQRPARERGRPRRAARRSSRCRRRHDAAGAREPVAPPITCLARCARPAVGRGERARRSSRPATRYTTGAGAEPRGMGAYARVSGASARFGRTAQLLGWPRLSSPGRLG